MMRCREFQNGWCAPGPGSGSAPEVPSRGFVKGSILWVTESAVEDKPGSSGAIRGFCFLPLWLNYFGSTQTKPSSEQSCGPEQLYLWSCTGKIKH